ncbi:outer membrane protein [Aestuariivirga sp.]|uniref:outer membrane protein n=1 Tax=Aestuariivirga sp. TaxID=2650926 RepID=UPI00391D73F8
MTTAALLFSAGVSQAADFVDVAPVSDWSGFYVGVHGGFGGGTFEYPITLSGFSEEDIDADADLTASGFFGGVQAGWNWQMDSLVLGVEADISASDIEGNLGIDVDTPGGDLSADAGSTVDWFGTARLRAGFLATPDLLLYATGGLAWGSVTAQYDIDLGGDDLSGDETTDHLGWTIGGGVEYNITESLSLKTEYLYVDLGDEELYDDEVFERINLEVDQDISFHTIRAGLNFRF